MHYTAGRSYHRPLSSFTILINRFGVIVLKTILLQSKLTLQITGLLLTSVGAILFILGFGIPLLLLNLVTIPLAGLIFATVVLYFAWQLLRAVVQHLWYLRFGNRRYRLQLDTLDMSCSVEANRSHSLDQTTGEIYQHGPINI